MRIVRVFILGTVFAFPSLSMAELPFSRQGLGQIEATLNFCSQTNPQAAEKYGDHGNRLTKGFPGAEVEEARKSEEYKKAYESVTTALSKVAKDDAAKACSSLLEAK